MSKQLNINLAFQADTKQAEAGIRSLWKSLDQISNIKSLQDLDLNKNIQTAIKSAKQLQFHLNKAFNTKTGNFDLKKLNQSLKKANTSLSTLTTGLLGAGLDGEQAFMNVQKAVANSSVQINQANGVLNNFLISLKNTARWQISSSILHGFMGAISSAYRYSQDLDESLNNIRIVTGNNTDEMAAFAEQANKAAKALDTTTVKYTDAALIYYQQGLSDNEVIERTNATVKMANVVGENTQKVSDQMTAIWNNYDDGSKSLEYYADVITALGAATASSSNEIAQGLEKFSAISNMIGLSYEYATSALATVTAKTRQSADVVGTAFKTIFARIQGLKLGDTLDDGTDFNKYSEGLLKVGINIKDQNDQLKSMDQILNEMGSKWKTLGKDQQVALAQTVAGLRQWNQLVSLMDNWDFFKENLDVALNSTGELQNQADIYAESWEAASKRVKASAETLYGELIPSNFMINLTNGFAEVLNKTSELVKGFGGLKSILLLVSTVALNKMGPSIATSINQGIDNVSSLNLSLDSLKKHFVSSTTASNQLKENLNKINSEGMNNAVSQVTLFEKSLKQSSNTSLQMQQQMIGKAVNSGEILSDSFQGYLTNISKVYNMQSLIEQNASRLTNSEKEQLSLMQQQAIEAAELKSQEEARLDTIKLKIDSMRNTVDPSLFDSAAFKGNVYQTSQVASEGIANNWKKILDSVLGVNLQIEKKNKLLQFSLKENQDFSDVTRESANIYQNLLEINNKLKNIANQTNTYFGERAKLIKEIVTEEEKNGNITGKIAGLYRSAADNIKEGADGAKTFNAVLISGEKEAQRMASVFGNSASFLEKIKSLTVERFVSEQAVNDAAEKHNQLLAMTGQYLQDSVAKASTYGGVISSIFSGASTIAMSLSSISNFFETMSDDEASFTAKLTSGTMALTMGMSGLMTVIKGVNTAIQAHNGYEEYRLILSNLAIKAGREEELINYKNALVEEAFSKKAITAEQRELFLKEKNVEATIKQLAANKALATSQQALMFPFIKGALIVGGVIAAVALLAKAVDNYQNKANRAAEKTSEALKDISEKTQKTKDEVKQLNESFDKYSQAVKTLNDLTDEMEGFGEATKEVNDQTLELLSKYPELAKMEGILVGKKGSYHLDPEKFQEFLNQENQKEKTATATELVAKSTNSEAQFEAKKEIFLNRTGLPKGYFNNIFNDFLETKNFGQAIDNYIDSRSTGGDYLKDQFIQNQTGIEELAEEYRKKENEIETNSRILASTILGSSASKEEIESFQNDFENKYQDKTVQWQAVSDDIQPNSGYFNKNLQLIQNYLQTIPGFEDVEFAKKDPVKGFDGNRTYIDSEGKGLPFEELSIIMSSYGAAEEVEKEIREKIYNSLEEQGINLDKNVSTSSANTLAKLLDPENEDIILSKETLNSIKQVISSLKGKPKDQEDFINQLITGETPKSLNDYDIKAESEKYKLETKEVERYADSLTRMAKESKAAGKNINGISEDLAENSEMAKKVAVANSRMNKGLVTLAKDFNNYKDVLSNSSKDSVEYSNALGNISDAMDDILGLDTVHLSESFLSSKENLDLMEQAVNGNTDAIEKLRELAAEDIVQNIEINDESLRDEVTNTFSEFQNLLDNQDLAFGATFDNTAALAGLNELIKEAGISTDVIQDYFNSLGYIPEIENVPATQTVHRSTTIDLPLLGKKTFAWDTTEDVSIPVVKSVTYNGDAGRTVNSRGLSQAKKSGGGGGGKSSPAKYKKPTEKNEVVDRYHEINAELERMNDLLSDNNKESDRLYGKKKINALKEEVKLLKEKNKFLETKKEQISNNLVTDGGLVKGYGFKIDENTRNITNYTPIMEGLYKQLNAAENKLNNFSTSDQQSKFEEATIEPIRRNIEAVEKAVKQYEETNKAFIDIENEIADNLNEQQDRNYEAIIHSIDIEIELDEDVLAGIETSLNILLDDFYSLSEQAALLSSKTPILQSHFDIYNNGFEKLKADFEAGNISQQAFLEGLSKLKDQSLQSAESLAELDKTMIHFYENSLEKADQELRKHTDHFDHYVSTLEHFQNMLGLIGRGKDYESIGAILEGQYKILENSLEIEEKYLESRKEELEKKRIQLESTPLGSKEREQVQLEYDAMAKAVMESEQKVMDATVALGEKASEILENDLAKSQKELEESLTGGSSIDEMMESIDRVNKQQEEYLTKTNQLYETNALLKQAELDMSKTDNELSKKKYEDFIKYTEALGKQEKLSEYELSIAQARYNLLQAQIALEDARNAQDSMRLVRNDSGNYDYVYTADMDNINKAWQDYEKAQNELYNIGLEGAKEYQTKYAETLQEATQKFAEINQKYRDGDYESEEEYHKAMSEAQDYYYNLLEEYQNLYQIGYSVVEEAGYANSIQKKIDNNQTLTELEKAYYNELKETGEFYYNEHGELVSNKTKEEAELLKENQMNLGVFKDKTEEYLGNCNDAFNNWEQNTDRVKDLVGKDLDSTKEKVDAVTDSSEDLRKKVAEEILPMMEDEWKIIDEVTRAWADQRDIIAGVIQDYINLAEKIRVVHAEEVARAQDDSRNPKPFNPSVITPTPTPGQGAGGGGNSNGTGSESIDQTKREKRYKYSFLGKENKKKESDYIYKSYESANSAATGAIYREFGSAINPHAINRIIESKIIQLKSGGYTGSWGPEGKLAMLHQKELVLNAEDTENMLAAVKAIRAIGPTLFSEIKEILSNNTMIGNNLLSPIAYKNFNDNNNQSIDQNVIIQADFPGVSAAVEIETALKTLVNDAAQYASIRK